MKPTQAQIDAATEAVLKTRRFNGDREIYANSAKEVATAALTAAARVGKKPVMRHTISGSDAADDDEIVDNPHSSDSWNSGYKFGVAATIERCAQVVGEILTDDSQLKAKLLAAIRALKE